MKFRPIRMLYELLLVVAAFCINPWAGIIAILLCVEVKFK